MQLSSILSACARNGVTVTQPRDRSDYYVLSKGNKLMNFYVNSDGYVGYITEPSPQTDVMTDCFCDYYAKTIKNAMQVLNPSGELVQHSNKPATTVNHDDVSSGVQVSKNDEKCGIEIRFPEKPSADVINSLKDKGFRWSPFNSVWWKKFNDADYAWAMETFMIAVEA